MEFGDRLPPPSSSSSTPQVVSSSASSSPVPFQTTSTKRNSPTRSSPNGGNSLHTTGDELFTVSGSSNGSPLVSQPALGLRTSSFGHSEFGGIGSLDLSAVAAHSQYGTFPDWWRPSEAHTRGAAAFVPLMGLHPLFASNLKLRDHAPSKSCASGVAGPVNGSSASSLSGNPAVSASLFPTKGNMEKTEGDSSLSQNLHQKTIQEKIEKKVKKKPVETSSMGGSHSFSDSSSDGEESSGDLDDMEEEGNDEDEDDSEDSCSDKDVREERVQRLTQNPSESIKKRPSAVDRTATQGSHSDIVPLTTLSRLQATSHPAGTPKSTAVEVKDQQHISVIQATGWAANNGPRTASPLLPRSSFNPVSFSGSSKHLSHLSSPEHSSISCSPKPPTPSLCSSSAPLSLSSLSKPPMLMASQKPQRKPEYIMASPKLTEAVDEMKESSGRLSDGRLLPLNNLKSKQPIHSMDSVSKVFPLQLKKENCNDANVFLSHHHQLNGVITSAVQDAPLALITKPCRRSRTLSNKPFLAPHTPPYPMPINLSTGNKEMSGSSAFSRKYFAPSSLSHTSSKVQCPESLHPQKNLFKTSSSITPVDLGRSCEFDIHSSKDSDSVEDDEDDVIEDEDSNSSLSESESNLGSDSGGSGDDPKGQGATDVNNDGERTPLKLVKAPSSIRKFSSNSSSKQPLLEPPGSSGCLHPAATVTSSGELRNHSTTSHPGISFDTLPGAGKRKRVMDERALQLPLDFDWQRETRIRTLAGRLQGEVAYIAPCGKKLRHYPEVMKYLFCNGITEISRDNFSFSTKVNIGVFYEAREGPEGLQWCLLADNEIAPSIIAMDGRRSRCTKSEHQPIGNVAGTGQWKSHPANTGENNLQDVRDAKLLRKLEAQEIARQAARIKMMKRLEKQAMAQAAKEARKQQAIMAAEEKRKKKEQMKILKQQEKIKRIQQIRLEKELRAQQILEAKKRKKEEAASARILEAKKRNKEKEMRRLQSVIMKHQELERHRLDMERERRKQHMMLMKAVEARRRTEERERLKKVKKNEKRLNKERKMELRRLELEKAKELKKPNEDMCLAVHKPFPELSRVPGLILPASTFSDCLMVLQFMRCFGKVLGLEGNPHSLKLRDLHEGLLNIGDSMGKVQDLLVSMLSVAVCDPGIPVGQKNKTALGDHLTNVEINRDNVSEVLQIYMNGNCEQAEQAALALSLRTKAFQAHSPSQKASVLAFLVNELCCSKAVISEIDKNIDHMTYLRKDKWIVEGKLRKLRHIHAKKTGKRENSVGVGDSHIFVIPPARNKCKRKEGDSEEEDDEEDDSEDQGDDDEEEEEESGAKRGKKAELCEEEDDGVRLASMEELEKLIEKTYKQQSQIRQKLFDSSQSLRSMTIGQDRYKRRYWLLPQCGGIFVEGMESSEGYEEVEKEKKRQRTATVIRVKEEQLGEAKRPVVCSPAQGTDGGSTTQETQQDKDGLNLFLQKPGSFSKLLEVAKMAGESDITSHNSCSGQGPAAPRPSHCHAQSTTSQQGPTGKADSSAPSLLRSGPWMACGPQSILHDDQLCKMLMEQSNQWFSLFPRSPCDESSVTSGYWPLTSIATKPLFPLTARPPAAACYSTSAGVNNASSVFQDLASQHAEGTANKFLFPASSNSLYKSETPEHLSDKPLCATFIAAEVAKTQDYPSPQPVPEEMLSGWWRVSDMEELHRLVKALHTRGIREKALQKQILKHKEYMAQLYAHCKDAVVMAEPNKQEVREATAERWCIEEHAMEVDISTLQQVEELERKVLSARLQVQGWMPPEPQSQREDLAYHEHELLSSSGPEKKGKRETSQEASPGSVVRRPNNPLDIAVIRLAELERNIERNEEEAAPGMRWWHKALGEVRSSAQLSLCIQQLHKSIAWERSIVKVHCQFCLKGDNEELLLFCDGCDKGCHTYCQRPKIPAVSEGDWLCPTCAAQGSDQSPQSRRQQSQTAGGGKKGSEVKRKGRPSALAELIREEAVSGGGVPKRVAKEFKKRRGDDSPPVSQARHGSPDSCPKNAKSSKHENTNGLATCRVLLAELEGHQDAWPFLTPVNHKSVPGYRKVIKKPMDFSTIREKLNSNQYPNLETFIFDVNLVFENCERFNEDDSDIGRAGHSMRSFFDKRWAELLK